ncbi:hypothetical protein JTE90_013668 [Oedothorax gibbosus]|uniref:Uncharacterized protein n=1 Tax=Oedothorax gibbosus TaxID=931172 RepID=A0AAV6VD59_9ARAC|nr:hypothetical protein JTE90_013668 [Oedothorax gibbosus]
MTTLLLVTLATAQVPPRPGGSGGGGAVTPGGVEGNIRPQVQLPVGPSNAPVGPSNAIVVVPSNVLDESASADGNFVPGQIRGDRLSGTTGGPYRRRGDHWHGSSGGSFFRHTGPPTIFHKFPSCQDIDMDIRETYKEMWRHRQIGPTVNRCKVQNIQECMYKDMNAARCNARTKPTEQCIQEVMSYVRGTNCGSQATTTDVTPMNDTTLTTVT